jgi:hypothetical protein
VLYNYKRVDGAHVEKNWSRVRELVGYLRYDTAAELEKLNAIWELDALSRITCCPSRSCSPRNGAGPKS